ncbi:MAG: bifunctional folylpolyglutamate synthase/dihydrofolate synthase [Acidobacteriota bacterium]|nr:bifunctional folylpolyglutamate synthase/dihydrofolate synthase [Acidobacteriota bacterium]
MTFAEAIRYLQSLGHETLTIKLGLSNTERLLDALGNPERSFQSVQIAGTNGKGSTSAMLDAICRAAGINTGLYTSPHLISYTERIRAGGREIAEEDFAACVGEVRAAALRIKTESGALPTFFEQLTAAALVAFRAAKVRLAILETGLGGRLDSTTAARAGTIAITPVSFDHEEYLGNTLAAIAKEKAAVIRPGVAAIIAASQPDEAQEVITARCRECDVTPRFTTRDIKVIGNCRDGRLFISFATSQDIYENVSLSLRGRHQTENASIAIEIAEHLRERGFAISREAIIEGLETAVHPGRLELLSGAPSILFDGAHNVAGAHALRAYLDEFVHSPITLVFGAMRDKDLVGIGALLFPAARKIILTRPDSPRAADRDTLERAVPPSVPSSAIRFAPTVTEAIARAREATPTDGLICITGSLYLIGEAKKVMSDE